MSCGCDECFGAGFVDPGDGGQLRRLGRAVPEPCRVGGVGGVESDGPLGADLVGGAVVDRRRGVQPDAGVAVDVVVVMRVILSRGSSRGVVLEAFE